MSVRCGFSECQNIITQELLSNGKKIYSCQVHLSEILQTFQEAASVKSVDIPISPQSKQQLINLLLNSLKTLKDFSESFTEMNSKTIKAILEEQAKVLIKTTEVSSNIIQAVSAIRSVTSLKTYETLSDLVRLLLEPSEKIRCKYEELKLVEFTFKKINGLNYGEVKDCIKEKMTRKRPQFEGKCKFGHNLLFSVDSTEYYIFINGGPASVRCDECKNPISSASLHCRICKFDCCDDCCIQKDLIIRTKPVCSQNHITELILDVNKKLPGLTCDLCKQSIIKNTWRCSPCDFDICEFCSLKLFVQPIYEYPLTCASKHRMICCLDNEKFYCKICLKAENNDISWKCDKCKIRYCKTCALTLGHKSPVCSGNHQMTHYCARSKSFGWFKTGSCIKCREKMDDFGFFCKICEFYLCEKCLIICPSAIFD
jgi:hypothetical protein